MQLVLFQNGALLLGINRIKAVLKEIRILCPYNGEFTSNTKYFQGAIADQTVTRNNIYNYAKASQKLVEK